jgi:hypothetical protein
MKTSTSLCVSVVASLLAVSSAPAQDEDLSFFITSEGPGNGADLGGLEGADAQCESLAAAVGQGDKEWRAYLSQSAADGKPAVNARDRIGDGPWVKAKGVQVAANFEDLHSDNNKLSKENSLT